MREASRDLNRSLEESAIRKKDERKLRKEGGGPAVQSQHCSSLTCPEPGCSFVGQTKVGLVNHTRQKHCAGARLRLPCPKCGGLFQRQGLTMHTRFCIIV